MEVVARVSLVAWGSARGACDGGGRAHSRRMNWGSIRLRRVKGLGSWRWCRWMYSEADGQWRTPASGVRGTAGDAGVIGTTVPPRAVTLRQDPCRKEQGGDVPEAFPGVILGATRGPMAAKR